MFNTSQKVRIKPIHKYISLVFRLKVENNKCVYSIDNRAIRGVFHYLHFRRNTWRLQSFVPTIGQQMKLGNFKSMSGNFLLQKITV